MTADPGQLGPELAGRQPSAIGLDERDVGYHVAGHDVTGHLLAVGELHLDSGRTADDVLVW
nr:hypothetical protein [Nakamurella leprariae]